MLRTNCWPLAFLSLISIAPAAAQVYLDMPNVVVTKPKLDVPDVKRRPEVWPRLDAGATVCKNEAELVRLAASRRGEAVGRPDCQIIRGPTPIQIVRRAGPGRTQVTLTEENAREVWTDAWLPEKAPSSAGRSTSIR